jgi:predicted O-methyltransferase YrrM
MMAARHRRHADQTLGDLERRLPSAASRFAVPFVYRGKGHFKSMRLQQEPSEIEALYHRVCELRPRTVLEIGTAKGGSLYLWAQAAADDAHLISIDMPSVGFGGYEPCRAPFYESFARADQRLTLLRADSHAHQTAQSVREALAGAALDFLFIDGDHAYDGVRNDFYMYGAMVRAGGLIAMHDILPNNDTPRIQVHRFWNEVRSAYEQCDQIIADTARGRAIGIGTVRVPPAGISWPEKAERTAAETTVGGLHEA